MKRINQITVFISCPGDVEYLKNNVDIVCEELNQIWGDKYSVNFSVKEWRRSVPLTSNLNIQKKINATIKEYDAYIGILQNRFGSPTDNINIETGRRYNSGTEEEFLNAKENWEQDKNIYINFYFKKPNRTPKVDETEQLLLVQKFRESLMANKKWVNDFENDIEFERAVRIFLTDLMQNSINITDNSLTLKLRSIKNSKITRVKLYFERKVISSEKYDSYSIYTSEHKKFLKDVLNVKNRIVLLSNAGVGKSTELLQLRRVYLKKDSTIFPIFIRLNNFKNTSLKKYIDSKWTHVPLNQLLLLMDGYDEIESKYRNFFIKELNQFCDEFPEVKVVLSSRSNFYTHTNPKQSQYDSLMNFEVFYLTNLENDQIKNYVDENLPATKTLFWDSITLFKIYDLLTIPFYLFKLVELYTIKNQIPKSTSEIYQFLIDERIQIDESKFEKKFGSKQINLRDYIFEKLERLAISMETLGRNYISNEEYMKLFPFHKDRYLIEHKTLFKKHGNNWEFENNTFQEYLAARYLSKLKFSTIKSLISFKPNYTKIIPSWTNTVSFLLQVYKNEEIKLWIMKNEPELILKFEKDKISSEIRNAYLRTIFDEYKEKKIWIDYNKFRYFELAKFSESASTIKFLLEYVEIKEYYTTLGNAINLLGHMSIPKHYQKKVENKLLEVALNYDNPVIQNDAILSLSALEFNSRTTISKLVKKLGKSDNDWIRYGLYSIINESDYQDEYVDLYIEGIEFIRDRRLLNSEDSRLGNEAWELERGLKNLKEYNALLKLLKYFLKNPRDLQIIGIDRITTQLWSNLVVVGKKSVEVFNLVFELLHFLNKEYMHEEMKKIHYFFDATKTNKKAFLEIYNNNKKYKNNIFDPLAFFLNPDTYAFIFNEYKNDRLKENDIWTLFNYMGYHANTNLDSFRQYMNLKTGNKFIAKPIKDFESIKQKNKKRETNLLFNREAILTEIKKIFDKDNKRVITQKYMKDTNIDFWNDERYLYKAVRILDDYATIKGISYSEIKKRITKKYWEQWSILEIYNLMDSDNEFTLTESLKEKVQKWCLREVKKIDFKTALVQKGTTFHTSKNAILLSFFLQKLKFSYPKKVLLDLISFDWFDRGIFYLLDFLSAEEIIKRIKKNIAEKEVFNDYEIKNYLLFSKKYKFEEIKDFALNIIQNENKDNFIRDEALDVLEFIENVEEIFPNIDNNYRWNIIDWLIRNNSKKVEDFLLSIFISDDEATKLQASIQLVKLENIEALKYYVKYIEKEKIYSYDLHKDNPLSSIRDLKALPSILRLLKLTYNKMLRQDNIDTLYRSVANVLENIALVSEENFLKVRNELEKFIKKNHNIEKINFLYSFIESLEQKYYLNKSAMFNIDEVIAIISNIDGQYVN